ncbi:cytochrome c [Solitalea sp. MAHUQ-68]|uniref:Cytochrome c n=1 Tax=Solitalea agri TaxID=2953739 RepID=A0A9X2JF98_9SPHI|nr:c-type cytochrome [Solitalea agri]MCO4294775.1 cytochrome c [Solitalea agri]
MIKKILKITGITLGSLIGMLVLAYGIISFNIYKRGQKVYTVEAENINIPSDSASIELGKHLSIIKGCQDCHGTKLDGKVFFQDALLGTFSSANLTLLKNNTDQDWIKAIRHGIKKDGRPLIIMPSDKNMALSEKDLAALIAYCKTLQESKTDLPPISIGPLGKVLDALGMVHIYAAEKIDHSQGIIAEIKPEVSIEFGKYIAQTCTGCHQPNFKGGENLAPGGPHVPDLTKTGAVGKWTEEQFTSVLRTGKRPNGTQMNTEDMPWQMTREYSDVEIKALYKFLNTL